MINEPLPTGIDGALPPARGAKRFTIASTIVGTERFFIIGEVSDFEGGQFLVKQVAGKNMLIGADSVVFPLARFKIPGAAITGLAQSHLEYQIYKAGGIENFKKRISTDYLKYCSPEEIEALKNKGLVR